jgi:predicted anti-sigma-YlaC factor YlaD
LIVLVGAAGLLSSCAVRQTLIDHVGDALAEGGAVYAADPDIELVGAATPFGLKLLESLSAESPRHRGLLLALARGFTQYAYAYVELPADLEEGSDVAAAYAARDRARALYLRARDYGLRALELAHPGFGARLAVQPAAAVAMLRPVDVPASYWTAAAWGAAISLGKDEPRLLAALPQVRQLAVRALALDERFGAGALHVLGLSLAMAESGPVDDRVARARAHLARAVELSGGTQAAPFVAFAESVSVPLGDRAEFDALLSTALAIGPDAAPAARLENAVFQRRARWLRSRAADLFGS